MSQNPHIRTVTEEGIFVRTGSTERVAPLPQLLPADAHATGWDPETLTLIYTVPAADPESSPTEGTLTLTQADLDAAVEWRSDAEPPVPERVTRRQLYLALYAAGIDLDVAVQNIQAATARREAEISVQTALYFPRTHDLVNSLAGQLGLTVSEVDDIYRAAAQITDQE